MTSDPSRAPTEKSTIAIVGGGPAGLIAAEIIANAGHAVTVYDQMASVGRKFLLAGRGGLNLTHSEPLEAFLGRFRPAEPALARSIGEFPPDALQAWSAGLGEATFVGSSGRVFPKSFKTSPLLRAWLQRLAALGVVIRTRHRFEGWNPQGALLFSGPAGPLPPVQADATVLALGGASWPRMGSDGAWVAPLSAAGILVSPLQPANCGVTLVWSEVFRARFEATPVKPVALTFDGITTRGEAMVTSYGLEGGAIYALSGPLRDAISRDGHATLRLDLRPDIPAEALQARLSRQRGSETLSTFLRKAGGLSPIAVGLLREGAGLDLPVAPEALASLIKSLPLRLTGTRPLERAISTAGGVRFEALDDALMVKERPGLFVAGEMLDWEAPTGGYLLQGTFATGAAAATGLLKWLERTSPTETAVRSVSEAS